MKPTKLNASTAVAYCCQDISPSRSISRSIPQTDNVGVTGIMLMVDGEPVDGSGIAVITRDVADVYHITATAVDAAGRICRAPTVDLNVFNPDDVCKGPLWSLTGSLQSFGILGRARPANDGFCTLAHSRSYAIAI